MEVKLKVVDGSHAGKIVKIRTSKFFIGREKDCHLRSSSRRIDRHHCALIVEGARITVRDFEARHGTFVNGQRVEWERALNPGDSLQVGPLRFEILIDRSETDMQPTQGRETQKTTSETASAKPKGMMALDKFLSSQCPKSKTEKSPVRLIDGRERWSSSSEAAEHILRKLDPFTKFKVKKAA